MEMSRAAVDRVMLTVTTMEVEISVLLVKVGMDISLQYFHRISHNKHKVWPGLERQTVIKSTQQLPHFLLKSYEYMWTRWAHRPECCMCFALPKVGLLEGWLFSLQYLKQHVMAGEDTKFSKYSTVWLGLNLLSNPILLKTRYFSKQQRPG